MGGRKSSKVPARPAVRGAPDAYLTEQDIARVLRERARLLAPADIEGLLRGERELRLRCGAEDHGSLFAAQMDLALRCLRDHAEGECPQIPYYTIGLLAAAVFYCVEPMDLIPDFLDRVGHLDDAAIMAMAFRLGRDGIRRYCEFRDLPWWTVIR